MKLSVDLVWRGLVKDKTFGKVNWLDDPKTFYLGVDASTPGLTVGNLAALMLARRLIEGGWKAILLAGGATSLVGDPGGKTSERELKSADEIAANISSIKKQITKLFAGAPHELVNNIDWLADLKLLDFLRETGKQFSMSELLQREYVTARLGKDSGGISYAEFSYSLLQGYDYWWLYKNKCTVLQIGASDQWGNILSGVALIRKKEGQEVHAFSMPLVINQTTGVKFGKSEAGAVWIDPAMTSPSQFYQFWINSSDDHVGDYLKIFTLLSKEEIEQIMSEHKISPASRHAQTVLAQEVTRLVHGKDGLQDAEAEAEALKGSGAKTRVVKLKSGIDLIEALVTAGLAESNTQARRFVSDKAVYIDNKTAKAKILKAKDYKGGRLLLRRGKKLQNSKLIELA